jgi:hypothetical protein
MSQLCQVVGDIQQEAAAVPTSELGAHIRASLEILTEYIGQLQNPEHSATSPEETSSAENDVLYAALFTALYLQELTTRPARRYAKVRLSFN